MVPSNAEVESNAHRVQINATLLNLSIEAIYFRRRFDLPIDAQEKGPISDGQRYRELEVSDIHTNVSFSIAPVKSIDHNIGCLEPWGLATSSVHGFQPDKPY